MTHSHLILFPLTKKGTNLADCYLESNYIGVWKEGIV